MRVERSRDADADLAAILAYSIENFGVEIASSYILGFEDALLALRDIRKFANRRITCVKVPVA